MNVLVAGAGGFIGGHLVRHLLRDGAINKVRAVDLLPPGDWMQTHPQSETVVADLRDRSACREVVQGMDWVFNLACDMGGMGFIETHKADCMLSVSINAHLSAASASAGVQRYFFASSACVYNAAKQSSSNLSGLREEDAYPADPEDGYGWEKLFSERLCRHMREDYGLDTRIARYHNVYGPQGTFDGGREKAPAAICRKVIQAKLSGRHEIEIWGDGEQVRSFQYIDDCLHGTLLLMKSDHSGPLNIGSSEMVTINQLVDLAEEFAGIRLQRRYKLDAPLGVRGRSSDNTLIRGLFDWEPSIPLRVGLEKTYRWIEEQITSGS
jgi:GDP-D-mannose 3',5'-epimerase